MKKLLPLSLLFLIPLACKSGNDDAPDSGDAESTSLNAVCPISGEPVGDEPVMVSFGDRDVALCCPGCKGDWGEMAAADKEAFLAKQ